MLEVILASSLSLVLLAALYAALRMHLTFAQRGPEQVMRAQTARAIVERISKDVRAVIAQPPAPPTDSSSGGSSSGATESTQTSGVTNQSGSGTATAGAAATTGGSTADAGTSSSASATTTTPSAYSDAFGVLGGADWVQLYIADYRPDLDGAELSALGGGVARASNVVRVSYSATYLTTRPDAKGRTQRLSLARTEVAAVAAEQFDTGSDESDFRATTDFLGDDLSLVQFQYWDDSTATWLDSWGVDTPLAPPRAIKVTISLQPPDELLETQMGLTGGQSTWQPTYSMVIPISSWVPDSDSSSSSEEL